jgi:hypothetical protein
MGSFILEMVFFVSLGVVVLMVARKLPLVEGFGERSQRTRRLVLVKHEWIEIIDRKLVVVLEKWLRRAKVILMKLDTFVSRHLEKAKEKQNGETNEHDIVDELHEGTAETEEKRQEG